MNVSELIDVFILYAAKALEEIFYVKKVNIKNYFAKKT